VNILITRLLQQYFILGVTWCDSVFISRYAFCHCR